MAKELLNHDSWWAKYTNFTEPFGKLLSWIWTVALGIGTFFLGMAAYFGADDITNVIKNVKEMNETVIALRTTTDNTNKILNIIQPQIFLIRDLLARNFQDAEDKQAFLNNISKQSYSNARNIASFEIDPTSVSEYENSRIIKNWSELTEQQEKDQYIKRVFDNFLHTGILESLSNINSNVNDKKE